MGWQHEASSKRHTSTVGEPLLTYMHFPSACTPEALHACTHSRDPACMLALPRPQMRTHSQDPACMLALPRPQMRTHSQDPACMHTSSGPHLRPMRACNNRHGRRHVEAGGRVLTQGSCAQRVLGIRACTRGTAMGGHRGQRRERKLVFL